MYDHSRNGTRLHKFIGMILFLLAQAQRTNLALRDCDGEKEMVEGFKKELSDMELRLRNGGLGGVADFDKFEAKLTEATDTSAMVSAVSLLGISYRVCNGSFQYSLWAIQR